MLFRSFFDLFSLFFSMFCLSLLCLFYIFAFICFVIHPTDMANNFYYCGELSLKLLIFKVDNNIFHNTQNSLDCTILIQIFRGSMPLDLP